MSFFRRRPPQSALDHLSTLYNEFSTSTYENLFLEEQNRNQEALQGWKSLHTTILYKLEHMERLYPTASLTTEERALLEEIQTIRDSNVKHLVRLQLLCEELERLVAAREAPSRQPATPTPTLRGVGAPVRATGPLPVKKLMMKTLRNLKQTLGEASTNHNSPASLRAANLIWNKPLALANLPSSDVYDASFDTFASLNVESTPEPAVRMVKKTHTAVPKGSRLIDSLTPTERHPRAESPPGPIPAGRPPIPTSRPATRPHSESSLLVPLWKSPAPEKDSLRVQVLKVQVPVGGASQRSSQTGQRQAASLALGSSKGPAPTPRAPLKVPPTPPLKPTRILQLLPTHKTVASNSKPPVPAPSKTGTPRPSNTASKPPARPASANTTIKGNGQNGSQVRPPVGRTSTAPTTRLVGGRSKEGSTPQPLGGTPSGTRPSRASQPPQRPAAAAGTTAGTAARPVGATATRPELPTPQVSTGPLDYSNLSEDETETFVSSLRGVDPTAAKQILNEIIVRGDEVYWDDIAGLEAAKNSLKETVVYPFLRPDLFSGLREPARGMLLFGPPGTGKTMLARAVATESHLTFFSISASSLTSKYLGESEKLVRALFQIAKRLAPSIIFVDEIDSILSARSDNENESSRRIKNEFLIQWSDLSSATANTDEDVSRVLVLAATNLPWAIDEAARRRFVRRQYIPLPEAETRKVQLLRLLARQKHSLGDSEMATLIALTEGFSGSDMTALARDGAMGPLRALGDKLLSTPRDQIRPMLLDDFKMSLKFIRPSVGKEGLKEYEEWAEKFGSSGV